MITPAVTTTSAVGGDASLVGVSTTPAGRPRPPYFRAIAALRHGVTSVAAASLLFKLTVAVAGMTLLVALAGTLSPVSANDVTALGTKAFVTLAPSSRVATFLMSRAATRAAAGDPKNALADYTEVIRIARTTPGVFVKRAELRRALGDHQGAVADYTEVLRSVTNDPNLFYERGVARLAADD